MFVLQEPRRVLQPQSGTISRIVGNDTTKNSPGLANRRPGPDHVTGGGPMGGQCGAVGITDTPVNGTIRRSYTELGHHYLHTNY